MPRPLKSCRSKKRFFMAHHAKAAAQSAARVYDSPMYVYPCPHCSWDQARNLARARVPVGGLV